MKELGERAATCIEARVLTHRFRYFGPGVKDSWEAEMVSEPSPYTHSAVNLNGFPAR